MKLSPPELERYNRQMIMDGWGEIGQRKLKTARVVITGAGGLDNPAAIYLAAAGVGHLTIIDRDRYELSNLNRQILGWQKDLGQFKAEASTKKLKSLNPSINIEALALEIKKDNVRSLIKNSDIVVDATDNWKTRFIINEGCVKEEIPFIHAGIFGFNGQITTIIPGKGPCLRCILPKSPDEIKMFPVLGATPGLFAMLQVMEVVKLIVGIGIPLVGRMLFFDGGDMVFNEIELTRDPKCLVCSVS